jgi:hypothetical protein
MLKRFFKYIEPLWLGNDKKISLRSIAAIALLIDFIRNVHSTSSIVVKLLNLVYKDKTIDPALVSSISGNLAQIAMILGIEAALLAAALALKTYQNNVFKVSDSQIPSSPVPDGEVK